MSDSRHAAVLRRVLAAARTVYSHLGWGWREEVYREALARELAPLHVACEVAQPIWYRGAPLSHVSVRWDMVVEGIVLVELKAVKTALPLSGQRQVQRYMSNHAHSTHYAAVAINFPAQPRASVQHHITFQQNQA